MNTNDYFRQKTVYCNTYLFSKLLSDEVHNVSKILSKAQINLFQKKYVVIPIHQERDNHWILMVIMNLGKIVTTNRKKNLSVQKTKFIFFDSTHAYKKVDLYCEKICKLLNYEWVRLNKDKQHNIKLPFNRRRIFVLYPEGKNVYLLPLFND